MHKYLFLIFWIFFSCEQKKIDFANGNVFEVQKNISYGKENRQQFDLYLPQNNSSETVFIMIHGGGWRGGKKEDFNNFMIDLMKKFPKNTFANMNYQLAGYQQYAIPTQPENIRQVMNFINEKTQKQNQFILVGFSSGAHISMMCAYHFDTKKQVKAVVNLVGPTQLGDESFKKYQDYKFVEQFLISSKSIPKNMKSVDFGSPVYWLSSAVPTISFYGNRDEVVPISQKNILDSAFHKTNIQNESHEFDGDHMGFENEENKQIIIEKIEKFLGKL